MANANEDDRLQKVLQFCWRMHQAELIQLSEMRLTKELLYKILVGTEPPEKWLKGIAPTDNSIAVLFGLFLAIWRAVNWKA
jgi:hypothetical protein